MSTTGMCVLLVCLCTVLPGQGTNASQDEYVDGLSEKSEYETAAVHLAGITASSTNPVDLSSSLSLGKTTFLFCLIFLWKNGQKVLNIDLLLGRVIKTCI